MASNIIKEGKRFVEILENKQLIEHQFSRIEDAKPYDTVVCEVYPKTHHYQSKFEYPSFIIEGHRENTTDG